LFINSSSHRLNIQFYSKTQHIQKLNIFQNFKFYKKKRSRFEEKKFMIITIIVILKNYNNLIFNLIDYININISIVISDPNHIGHFEYLVHFT